MAQGLRQCFHDITFYLILLLTVATLGSLQYGFHLAELNAPEDVITCRKKSIHVRALVGLFARKGFLPSCIPMTAALFGTVSSSFTVGGLLGALVAGPFSSVRGRRPAMQATAAVYFIGAGIESISETVLTMCIGRVFSGIGAGASTVIVPLYISEISPPKERGLFGAMTQVSINVGILLTQTMGYYLSHDNAWRYILATGVFISLVQGVGLLLVPESPSWLAAHGDPVEAEARLQAIRGKHVDISEEVTSWGQGREGRGNVAEEEESLLARRDRPVEGARHLGFVQVARDPLYRPAIVAVVGIMFAQQLCGINSVIMYSVSLLNNLLPLSSALLTILISVVNLLTTIACAPLPDRLGRKTCLLISIVGQGSSAFALALSIVFQVKILSAVSVLLFVGFFAVGLGPVPYIMASELVGQEAVGATQSWSLGSNYVATFFVAQFFPIINKALNDRFDGQGWVYFLFAALAVLSALFVAWKVPETRGKKDIDEVWGRARRMD